MNRITGTISQIEVQGSLSLVAVETPAGRLSSIIIDTPETSPYLQKGNTVQVIFKESEVVIGLNEALAVSLQNRIKGKVSHLEQGQLLTKVVINSPAGEIISHITTNAAKALELSAGKEVCAMIKTNEVMLSE